METMQSVQNNKLRLVYGDVTLGVHGENFRYIFSYQRGGLESLHADGREWIYRTPQPAFWRATTDNDRGNGFSYQSAMWMGADMFMACRAVQVTVDGERQEFFKAPGNNRIGEEKEAKKLEILFVYETATTPSTEVTVCYTVEAGGLIRVAVHYSGKQGLPELPAFGLRFIMPTRARGFRYEGVSSETYPDRMAGGVSGIYEIEGLPVTPYLVPQDCGVHMNTSWIEITRDTVLDISRREMEATKLRFECVGEPFAFSCLPYTPQELESAAHQEDLPLPRRTVLTIFGAVRGVGGIDSWGSNVEPQYRISAEKDIDYMFTIQPV